MEPVAIFAVGLAALGIVALVAGVQARSAVPALNDPGEYLRSLEVVEDERDEFAILLKEPFLTRVLRQLRDSLSGGQPAAGPLVTARAS